MEHQTNASSRRLGKFTVDTENGFLFRDKETIFLRPKAQALLSQLAKNVGRVVSKAELMDAVWPGIFVTEDSLTQSIREIRKILGDESQTLIRTVSKRGYILAAETDELDPRISLPTVAVLRFRNETDDEYHTPIVDGFGEDIINGLARFRTVTVLARHSSFAVANNGRQDWAEARSKIGASYLVDGSLRRSGRRTGIIVNLIDAESLVHLWGDQYETEGDAIFDVQREIVETIVGRLAHRIEGEGVNRARRKAETDLDAYELVLRGVALLRTNDPVVVASACAMLEAAIAKDPNYGLAHAELAFARVMQSGLGRSSPSDLNASLSIAKRAVELSPDQPTSHRVLSFVRMYQGEYGAAEHHLRRSIDLNPSEAESTEQLGYLLALRGRPVEALGWMDRAVKLNPIHPPWYEHDRAFALYILGRYEEAATSIELTPTPPPSMLTWLAACYAQMGDLNSARRQISRVAEVHPSFSILNFVAHNGTAFEHAAEKNHFAEGVMLALDHFGRS